MQPVQISNPVIEPLNTTNESMIPEEASVNVQPISQQQPDEPMVEEHPHTRNTGKKSIPLMPEEKSSGVLHIRLGELRSYVDFMTQSGKIS